MVNELLLRQLPAIETERGLFKYFVRNMHGTELSAVTLT
jgi:hypothetical protein